MAQQTRIYSACNVKRGKRELHLCYKTRYVPGRKKVRSSVLLYLSDKVAAKIPKFMPLLFMRKRRSPFLDKH